MASSSNELNTTHQIRSFSLPSKSNLIDKKIQQELEKLRIKEASSTSPAETISIGLSGLADLYSCINQVLSLPLSQQSLSLRKYEKRVGEQLKVCSNLENICTTTKGILQQQKKVAADLQSALSSSEYCESKTATYISSRKEVIKKAKGLTQSLKQLVNDDSFGSSTLFQNDPHQLSSEIKATQCVSIISASMYESLLFFLSSPVSKPTLGSLVSKLIHKTSSKSISRTKTGNALTDADIAVQSLGSGINGDKVQIVQQRLEDLVSTIKSIEIGLNNACIQLSETKSCLMGILSF